MENRAMHYAGEIAQMIRFETVFAPENKAAFEGQRALMKELFPRVWSTCQVREFDGSLLICWPGRQHRDGLLLMSHQDVVEAPGQWKHPPYSGQVVDGQLWGRGTIDVKANLYCILRAVEELIGEGVVPERDVYVATSDREEVGGNDLIADYLKENGISIGLLLDEGSCIQECPVTGIEGRAALVSVAEKGYMDIRCIARSNGGHASSPEKGTPLPRLGAFMCQVEEEGLFQPEVDVASEDLFARLAPKMGGEAGEILADLKNRREDWDKVLTQKELNMLNTTIAFTMASGSKAPNVIPQEASVTCNVRMAPGHSVEMVMKRLGGIAAQHNVELELLRHNEPSPITDPKGRAFHQIEAAMAKVYPGLPVLPFLLAGGTDTKHFTDHCPNCLRHTPMIFTAEQRKGIHGLNEHIDIDVLPGAVDFFKALVQGME